MINKALRSLCSFEQTLHPLNKNLQTLFHKQFQPFGNRPQRFVKKSLIKIKKDDYDPKLHKAQTNAFPERQSLSKSSPTPTKKINKYNDPSPSRSLNISAEDLPASSRSIPFDIFTLELSNKSPEQLAAELQQAELYQEEMSNTSEYRRGIPWNFDNKMEKPKEENLLTPLGLERTMNYEVALGLFKRYVEVLKSGDVEEIRKVLETTFGKKCWKYLEKLETEGCKIEVEGMKNNEETDIELYKVTNYFCVDVSSNRKKNAGEQFYHVFDNVLKGFPVRNIVKKKTGPNAQALIKVVIDLYIETPVCIKVVDKNGNVVEKSEKSGDRYVHHMMIENDVLQVDYKTLKRNVKENEEILDPSAVGSFQMIFSHDNWKIIDFDNYMQGNDFVSTVVNEVNYDIEI